MLGQPRNPADMNLFPTALPQGMKPIFVQTMEFVEEELVKRFSKTDCHMLYICCQPTPSLDGKPKMYSRFSAFGDSRTLTEAIIDNMLEYRAVRLLIVESFCQFVIKHVEDTDSDAKDLRRIITRYYSKMSNGRTSKVMEGDEVADIIASIASQHPERSARIPILRARAKTYRKSGLNDMAIELLDEVNRLQDAIIADNLRASKAEIETAEKQRQAELDMLEKKHQAELEDETRRKQMDFNYDLKLAQLDEALRCKELRANERLAQQQWEHDFASLERQQKFLRDHIAKAEEALKELNKQEYAMRQQSQYATYKVNAARKNKKVKS